jgi:hypothetical protein
MVLLGQEPNLEGRPHTNLEGRPHTKPNLEGRPHTKPNLEGRLHTKTKPNLEDRPHIKPNLEGRPHTIGEYTITGPSENLGGKNLGTNKSVLQRMTERLE